MIKKNHICAHDRVEGEFKFNQIIVFRWHCTKSSDWQVRVRGAPSNLYGVNVTKAAIGAYM